jgi:glycosyltransferase involved in cell wall biosynthesis
MNVSDITAIVLTFNEEPNIARCLHALKPIGRVIVVDSGSTDATLAICKTFSNVEVFSRPFDNFAKQLSFAKSLVCTLWALDLDCDYIVPASFWNEIKRLSDADAIHGYSVDFNYLVYGKNLHSTLYPRRTVLYRCKSSDYVMEGHAGRLVLKGKVLQLNSVFLHDDRKDVMRWLANQTKYAKDNVHDLSGATFLRSMLKRLRPVGFITPLLILLYCLFAKGLILRGRAGIYYSCQRMYAELLACILLLDQHVKPK